MIDATRDVTRRDALGLVAATGLSGLLRPTELFAHSDSVAAEARRRRGDGLQA